MNSSEESDVQPVEEFDPANKDGMEPVAGVVIESANASSQDSNIDVEPLVDDVSEALENLEEPDFNPVENAVAADTYPPLIAGGIESVKGYDRYQAAREELLRMFRDFSAVTHVEKVQINNVRYRELFSENMDVNWKLLIPRENDADIFTITAIVDGLLISRELRIVDEPVPAMMSAFAETIAVLRTDAYAAVEHWDALVELVAGMSGKLYRKDEYATAMFTAGKIITDVSDGSLEKFVQLVEQEYVTFQRCADVQYKYNVVCLDSQYGTHRTLLTPEHDMMTFGFGLEVAENIDTVLAHEEHMAVGSQARKHLDQMRVVLRRRYMFAEVDNTVPLIQHRFTDYRPNG